MSTICRTFFFVCIFIICSTFYARGKTKKLSVHFATFLPFSLSLFVCFGLFQLLLIYSFLWFCFCLFFFLVVKFDVCSKDECRFYFALFSARALAVASGSLSRVVTCMCVCMWTAKMNTKNTLLKLSFLLFFCLVVAGGGFASSIISLIFSLVAFLFVEAFLFKKKKITTKT